MGLTLTQARSVLGTHLDDPIDGTGRYSTAEADLALSMALSACLTDYVTAGHTRFDTEIDSLASSASDGTVSLSAIDPMIIREVAIETGGGLFYPIYATKKGDKQRAETTAHDLRITYVPEYALPSTTSHPLVGSGATAANSWLAFDEWICARAALRLAVKDAEGRDELRRIEQDLRQSVLLRTDVPLSRRFPSPPTGYTAFIRWTWLPGTKQMQLCRVVF